MKVAVIGAFGIGHQLLNGQTIKTKIFTDELERQLGQGSVRRIDTCGIWNILLMFPRSLWALMTKKNILIFPAHRGVILESIWLVLWNYIFRKRLHYVVVGGWLPAFLDQHKITAKALKHFYGIYVETSTMKQKLDAMGYSHVEIVPNCKELKIVNKNELNTSFVQPYKLCTFSRVMREKGIGEAVQAVKQVNSKIGKVVYTLDIYGSIDESQADWFAELQETFPTYITYKGCVSFDKSVETLKDYFALLFPTCFYTEGIPGTIIDAYAAGLPVISAKWMSYSDLVDDACGIGFEFQNWEELNDILVSIINNPETVISKKVACVKKAEQYLPHEVISNFIVNLY